MEQSQEVVKRPGSTTTLIAPASLAGVNPGVLACADQAPVLVLPALGTLGVLRAKGAPEAISGLSIDLFWLNLLFFYDAQILYNSLQILGVTRNHSLIFVLLIISS